MNYCSVIDRTQDNRFEVSILISDDEPTYLHSNWIGEFNMFFSNLNEIKAFIKDLENTFVDFIEIEKELGYSIEESIEENRERT